jgi:transcriptional regulator with XRE-family HTH domain
MKFKKIDVAALAKDLEYKPSEIRNLLTGMREPSMKKLILLANLLGCSVDYLLGLAPEPQRASIVIEADTNAIKPQPDECGQTSGQISGKAGRFVAMAPKLLDFDFEMLIHIAKYLIERNEKGLLKFVKIVRQSSKKEAEKAGESAGKAGLGAGNADFDDDVFDEDELWGDDDSEQEKAYEKDFDDDDDFDDDGFDD